MYMKFIGRVHIFGDNVLCDLMISGKHIMKNTSMKELIPFLMEDIDKGFAQLYKPGDIIVAGENFGCGSTRAHAVLVMKEAGVKCVVAKYFSRGFFRNGINEGITLVESNWDGIENKDIVEVDTEEGVLSVKAKGLSFTISPLPDIMKNILIEDGLINYYNKNGSIKLKNNSPRLNADE